MILYLISHMLKNYQNKLHTGVHDGVLALHHALLLNSVWVELPIKNMKFLFTGKE